MILERRQNLYHHALDFAQRQVAATIDRSPDYFPIYTTGGRWRHDGELWTDWTGGFFAGMMWKFYQRTADPTWRARAEHYSRLLTHRQHDRAVHDLGFIFLNTYRPWFELTGEPALREVLVQAGRTLAMRFMERGQYLRSFVAPESLFIDVMMNVPLIFCAANITGDEALRRVALAHSRTTRDKIVRADGSTAHEGIFDLTTGEFLRQSTQQGLRPDSAWARGLAWSLYGYSQVYALTGLDEFLDVAERNAAYWLANLPADGVPWWDFCADLSQPAPWGKQKDSSAGAIAASGLLDLARQTKSPERAAAYRQTALTTLDQLAGPDFLADQTPGWEGIVRHGVYHTAKNLGVDESVMWGEFFFVEALSKPLARCQAHLKVEIRRYVSDSIPGWIECVLVDANGQEILFIEKVPVIGGDEDLDGNSKSPTPGFIDCTIVENVTGPGGERRVVVDTEFPWGVESTDGEMRFTVRPDQLEGLEMDA